MNPIAASVIHPAQIPMRGSRLFGALVALGLLLSCCQVVFAQSAGEHFQAVPLLGPATRLEPGILLHQVTLTHNGVPQNLWIYEPEQPADGKRPVVLIGGAGSHLIDGMTLSASDRPEHLPYVRAGFVVVAYDISGMLPAKKSDQGFIRAVRDFKAAQAGVVNMRAALEYALAGIPNLDAKRLYTAGHSSAATLSLLSAEREPRIAACIAYAPCCDLKKRVGAEAIKTLTSVMPDYPAFVQQSSPLENTALLKCPVFVFHADDDTNVPTEDNIIFVNKLKQTNERVTFMRVPTGDHYHSMINQGISKAIQWLQQLPLPASATK